MAKVHDHATRGEREREAGGQPNDMERKKGMQSGRREG